MVWLFWPWSVSVLSLGWAYLAQFALLTRFRNFYDFRKLTTRLSSYSGLSWTLFLFFLGLIGLAAGLSKEKRTNKWEDEAVEDFLMV